MKIFTFTKLGRIVLLAAVVAIAGCSSSKTDQRLNGAWAGTVEGNETEYKFKNGAFESFLGGSEEGKGTYTTDNGSISINSTHIFGGAYNDFFAKMGLRGVNLEAKWYPAAEFAAELKAQLVKLGVPEKQVDAMVASMVGAQTASYIVDDKNLVMTFKIEGDSRVVTLAKK